MKALVIDGAQSSVLCDYPEPKLTEGNVLLAVKHVGLCGSDYTTFLGKNPLVDLPRVPGHEIGAEILEVGAGVPEEYAPGKRVIVVPLYLMWQMHFMPSGPGKCLQA